MTIAPRAGVGWLCSVPTQMSSPSSPAIVEFHAPITAPWWNFEPLEKSHALNQRNSASFGVKYRFGTIAMSLQS